MALKRHIPSRHPAPMKIEPHRLKPSATVQRLAADATFAARARIQRPAVAPTQSGEELVPSPGGGFQVRSLQRHTLSPPSGTFNFVRIYGEAPRSRPTLVSAKLAHAQLAGGRPVIYAGTASFDQGQMRWWSNYSGTYQPIAAFRAQAGLPDDKFVPWQKLQMGGVAMQRGTFTERRAPDAPRFDRRTDESSPARATLPSRGDSTTSHAPSQEGQARSSITSSRSARAAQALLSARDRLAPSAATAPRTVAHRTPITAQLKPAQIVGPPPLAGASSFKPNICRNWLTSSAAAPGAAGPSLSHTLQRMEDDQGLRRFKPAPFDFAAHAKSRAPKKDDQRPVIATISQAGIKEAVVALRQGKAAVALDERGLILLKLVDWNRLEITVEGYTATAGHVRWGKRTDGPGSELTFGVENIDARYIDVSGCGLILACAFVYFCELEDARHLCLSTTDTSGGLWARLGLKEVSLTIIQGLQRPFSDMGAVLANALAVGEIKLKPRKIADKK